MPVPVPRLESHVGAQRTESVPRTVGHICCVNGHHRRMNKSEWKHKWAAARVAWNAMGEAKSRFMQKSCQQAIELRFARSQMDPLHKQALDHKVRAIMNIMAGTQAHLKNALAKTVVHLWT